MINSKRDIVNKIEDVRGIFNVKVFNDDNIMVIDENMTDNRLFHFFKNLELDSNGGADLSEFYIIYKGKELTIQIEEITTVDKLDLEWLV